MPDGNDDLRDETKRTKERPRQGERRTTRRSCLEAAGGLLGSALLLGAGTRVGSAYGLPHLLTIHGDQGFAEYEFTVSGDLERSDEAGATIDDWNVVEGSTASGHVWGGRDSYRFSGEIVDFALEAPATVYLDGVEVDPELLASDLETVLTIHGDQGFAEYEFTVSGDLERSTDMGATIDDWNLIEGSTASGHVFGGRDSYRFSGEIVDFALDAPATVYLDGVEVDPEFLTSDLSTFVTISGDQGFAEYEFAVTGDLEKSTDMDATIDDHDVLDGPTASGHVWSGRDSYRFSGAFERFELEAPATVYLDGVEVDPEFVASDLSDFVTISGDRGFAEYEFTVSGDLERSTDMGATIDDWNLVQGSTASGHVFGGRDSYRISGPVTDFELDAPATVYLNGEEIAPEDLIEDEEEEEEDEIEDVEFAIASSRESYATYVLEVAAAAEPIPVTDDDEIADSLLADERVRVSADGDRYRVEGWVRTPADAADEHGDTFRWEPDEADWGIAGLSVAGADESDLEITINGESVSLAELPDGDADPEVNVGGGEGYLEAVSRSEATYVVSTERELRDALGAASRGDVVYVSGGETITLGRRLDVPAGVTLASDRGIDGSDGGELRTHETLWPFVRVGDGVRISGLGIHGPNPNHRPYDENLPISIGVDAEGSSGVRIDNCEISGFRYGGVRTGEDTHVHHNHVHHCAYGGLGYGVATNVGHPLIEYNYINYTRHGVMSNGNNGYTCRYNRFGPDAVGHVIDVHEPGGTTTEIHHNTVEAATYHADATASWYPSGGAAAQVVIRGVPTDVATIHDNWFYNPYSPSDSPPSSGDAAILQRNNSGWTNISISNNAYGEREPDSDVGCPR